VSPWQGCRHAACGSSGLVNYQEAQHLHTSKLSATNGTVVDHRVKHHLIGTTLNSIYDVRQRNRESMRKALTQALTVKDIAHRLNCSDKTARSIIKSGELRSFRVGTEFRVLPTDLDAYIESQMESA
jgi:excisionase family DNA binding protein